MASSVQLLGVPASQFVNRVQIALNLKSIEYELIREDPRDKSQRLLKANPVLKKIPVLIHDGKPICESLIIVQYIDDTWNNGPSILPSNPHDRAIARFWGAYIDDKWLPLVKELEDASTEDARKEILDKIFDGLVLLEEAFVKCSKGKPYFGGDNVGYLDIALGSFMGWMKAMKVVRGIKWFDEIKNPSLAKWAERFHSHDVVKNVIPETQKLIDNYITILAKENSTSH